MRIGCSIGALLLLGACGPSLGAELDGRWIVGTYHAESPAGHDEVRRYEFTDDGAFVTSVHGCDGTTSELGRDRFAPSNDGTVLVLPAIGESYLALPELDFTDGIATSAGEGHVDIILHAEGEIDGLLALAPGEPDACD